jgi:hypothetical protein
VRTKQPDFFLPQAVLAARFRTRLKEALGQVAVAPELPIPSALWQQPWVVDVQPVGSGEHALKCLAAYVYRTALGPGRILQDQDDQITLGYKDGQTHQPKSLVLDALEFIRRFLQHILPRGFQRIRRYGWLSSAAHCKWDRILALLDWKVPAQCLAPPPSPPLCPDCGQPMVWVGVPERGPP